MDQATARAIIEKAGGKYLEVVELTYGVLIKFCEPVTQQICSLYLSAISMDNVEMALKKAREDARRVPLA